jgi:predicted nucleotide-binding protein
VAKTDPRVLERLQQHLGIGRAQAYKLVQDHARDRILPRDLAAISLALEKGINVHRFAAQDQLATIRAAKSGGHSAAVQAEVPTVVQRATKTRPGRADRVKTKGTADKVFVIHGRDEKVRKAVFNLLRGLHLNPLEWSALIARTRQGSPIIAQVLDAAFRDAVAVVVLLTPDDDAVLRKELQRRTDKAFEKKLMGQARPNVLFEAGIAFGRMPDKTILVEVGKLRPLFSDISGRHTIRLTNDVKTKMDLARRLKTAGCAVNLDGDDWQDHDPVLDR